jgi:hypothetical protein
MPAKIFNILIGLSFIQAAYSQTKNINTELPDIFINITNNIPGQAEVTIKQDEQLRQLIKQYIEYRRKENKILGYRIRIFSDSGQSARQHAFSERDRFDSHFPDITSYPVYEQPNFKVYVGDFRTRDEAYRAYKMIQKDFPKAFLVPGKINPPKL